MFGVLADVALLSECNWDVHAYNIHVRGIIVTSIILYTGDNGTVVYLEEVPIQSLPAIKGAYTCISFSYESLQTHIYMCMYYTELVCIFV